VGEEVTCKTKREAQEELYVVLADRITTTLKGADNDAKGLAAIMEVARKFLADNDTTAADVPGSPLGNVAEAVRSHPFDPRETLKQH
jgi:hypothetical protein